MTPDSRYGVFGAVDSDVLSVAGTGGTLLRAVAPFLFYSLAENDFSALLNQIGLAGAGPASPFFDPGLAAAPTPWISHLENALNPSGDAWVPDPRFGFSYTPEENFFTGTAA